MSLPPQLDLTPLERATGVVFGEDPAAPRFPKATRGVSPLQALEEVVLPYLRRPPCLVLFSGGRDSSAVLAVAAHAARKNGLPEPVAFSLRYAVGGAAADESAWQELVVSHLGLRDWVKVDPGEGLDPLGEIGQQVLRRHRLIFPTTPHILVPALEAGRGGAVLTGTGGDEAFLFRSRISDVLARRVRPRPRDTARLLVALGPVRLRATRAIRPVDTDWPWLTTHARRAFRAALAHDLGSTSLRWPRELESTWRSRSFQLVLASLRLLAMDYGVDLGHPLADPRFLAATGRDAGWHGYGDRTAAMRAIFGALLPDAVNSRTTKATFGDSFWTEASRAFARQWDGTGVNPELVDVEALHELWRREECPPAPTFVLLKQAWLAADDRAAGSQRAARPLQAPSSSSSEAAARSVRAGREG